MTNPPDHDVLEKPIVIIGAPRSGTTLLGDILKHHPSLAYVPEPRLTWRYGTDHKSDMLKPEDARPKISAFIRDSFAQSVRTAGRARLLEKTPANSLRMGFVERVLPGCKFVHIMRHGLDAVLSIQSYWEQHARGVKPGKLAERLGEVSLRRAPHYFSEMVQRMMPGTFSGLVGRPVWGPRIPGIQALLRDLEPVEVCCLQWRMCVEAACQFGRRLPADRYMECRLENMSRDLVGSVLDFCELESCDEVWTAFQQEFDPSQRTERSESADSKDCETIRAWIQPTLQWLGYD